MNLNNFGLVTKNPDGYNHRCKTCQKKHNEEYYNQTRDKQIADAKRRNKEKGEEYLAYLRNWHQENLEAHQKQNRDWYYDNKEYRQEYTAEWRQDNLEKCREYNRNRYGHKTHTIKKKDLLILYEYANSSCMYCGLSEEEHKDIYNEKLHKDHAINNGSNGIDNCILACKRCNTSKRDKDWTEWYTTDNPNYIKERYNKIKQWLDGFKV